MHGSQFLFLANVFWHLGASVTGVGSLVVSWVTRNKPHSHARVWLVVGLVLVFVATDQAWQDEHFNAQRVIEQKAELASSLAQQKTDLSGQIGFWRNQSSQKDGELARTQALLAQNISALAGAQTSANKSQESLAQLSSKILDLNKPVERKLTVLFFDTDAAANPHTAKVLLLTNVDIPSPRIRFVCDAEGPTGQSHPANFRVDDFSVGPVSGGLVIFGGATRLALNAFEEQVISSAWTPTMPFLANLKWSGADQLICNVVPQ